MIKKKLLTTTLVFTLSLSLFGCNKSTSTTPETLTNTTTTETTTTVPISTETETTEQITSSQSASKEDTSNNTTESSKETTTDTESSSEAQNTTTEAPTTTEAATTTEAHTESQTEVQTTTQAPTEKQTEPETTTQAPTHEHSYSSSVTKEPTCTAEGVKIYTCTCGNSYTESIPAKSHNFGSYTYNNDATYDADGTETATCSVCGAVDTRTASGTKLVHTHSYTSAVTKEATTTETGVITYTCGCGNSYTEEIPMVVLEHVHGVMGAYAYREDGTFYEYTYCDGDISTGTWDFFGACGSKPVWDGRGYQPQPDTTILSITEFPSWYDEHPDKPLNVTTGSQHDGSLEAYYVSGQFDWTGVSEGCGYFGYSNASDSIGKYKEGFVNHGYLYLTDYMKHVKGVDGHNFDEVIVDADTGVITKRCTLCGFDIKEWP